MNGEKVKQIVSEAFDLESAQREVFVRQSCGDDPSLLAEALSLLDAASNASDAGFLPSRATSFPAHGSLFCAGGALSDGGCRNVLK